MIKIAIVDDCKAEAGILADFARQFGAKKNVAVNAVIFDNAISFLSSYACDCDVVFMDIDMPDMNGMDAAAKLRGQDKNVIIIFVTNMQQYAIKGYSVGALDFILKPITNAAFFSTMNKIVKVLDGKEDREVIIKTSGGIYKVFLSRIKYFEMNRHRLTYHTEVGDFESWGKINDLEKTYKPFGFSRCNSGYLVNLRYVRSVIGDDVTVGDDVLKISRAKKKDFMADLTSYFGRL